MDHASWAYSQVYCARVPSTRPLTLPPAHVIVFVPSSTRRQHPSARRSFGSGIMDGRVYVSAGWEGTDVYSNDLWYRWVCIGACGGLECAACGSVDARAAVVTLLRCIRVRSILLSLPRCTDNQHQLLNRNKSPPPFVKLACTCLVNIIHILAAGTTKFRCPSSPACPPTSRATPCSSSTRMRRAAHSSTR